MRALGLAAAATCLIATTVTAAPASATDTVVVSSLVGVGSYVKVVSVAVPAANAPGAIASLEKTTGQPASIENQMNALETAKTNDTYRVNQWALDAVPFETAWGGGTGTGILVAVVDSGVDASHPELAGRVLPGRDFTGTGPATTDANGHGTHVAGIIAATAGNSQGIAGAAPGVTILPVKVLDATGAGWDADVAAGIIYAADSGAKVINLSLGGDPDPLIQQAVDYANGKGSVIVAAAGNSGLKGNTPSYPAAYTPALAVGAVDTVLAPAAYTTRGDYLDVAAPGSSVISTWVGNGYATMSGTSMAAPYASAEVALLAAAHPELTATELVDRVKKYSNDVYTTGFDTATGAGLIDPVAALCGCAPTTPKPTTPAPTTPTLPPAPTLPTPTLPIPSKPSRPVTPTPTLPQLPAVPTPTMPDGGPARVVALTGSKWSTPGKPVTVQVDVQDGHVGLADVKVALARTDGHTTYALTDELGQATFTVKPRTTTDYIIQVPVTSTTLATTGAVTIWVGPRLEVTYTHNTITWTLTPASGQTVTIVQVDPDGSTKTVDTAVVKTRKHAHRTTRKLPPGNYRVEVSPTTGLLPVKSSTIILR